jgi:hypothetical protein
MPSFAPEEKPLYVKGRILRIVLRTLEEVKNDEP